MEENVISLVGEGLRYVCMNVCSHCPPFCKMSINKMATRRLSSVTKYRDEKFKEVDERTEREYVWQRTDVI